jgi:hypothetical protein
MQTKHRAGSFFILVGLALLLMFIASIMSREVHAAYLFFSLLCFITAFLFLRTRKAAESGRFRMLHQARERRRQGPPGGNKSARPGGLFGLGRRQSRKDRKREEEKNQKSGQT